MWYLSLFFFFFFVIEIKTGSNALMYREANVITEQDFSGLVPDLCIAQIEGKLQNVIS